MTTAHHPADHEDRAAEWEELYSGTEPIWSGNPNAALVDAVAPLPRGRAVDLGCGEGGDAIWLARQGWEVDAVDLATTAITRARAAAQAAAVSVDFHTGDLLAWSVGREGAYDLVCASFLHSRDDRDRQELLTRAAELVAPGGRLLIVSHAGLPHWEHHRGEGHHPVSVGPETDRAMTGIGREWSTEVSEVRKRTGTAPDGTQAVLEDSVLLVRRPA